MATSNCPAWRFRAPRSGETGREEAVAAKARDRRKKAVAKVQAALDKAEREHANRAADIQNKLVSLEQREIAERRALGKKKANGYGRH